MIKNNIIRALALSSVAILCLAGTSQSKESSGIADLENALRKPARTISEKLKGKVCVLDFTEAGESIFSSEFGQRVADFMSNHLVNQKKSNYQIVERRELIKIMKDSILFGNDPKTIDRLQQEAGMDILVSGTYSIAGDEISISIKATSAKTGTLVASANCRVEKTAGFEKMMAHKFKQVGVPADESSPLAASEAALGAERSGGEGDILEIETGVFYEGGDGKIYPIREGMVLTSKDNYCIYARPKQECYLYIYQVDSSQKAFKLFPNSNFKTAKNPIKAGTEYWIPNDKEFLFLDENVGREEIYVFATKQPASGLENIKEATQTGIQETIKTMGVGGKRGSEVIKKVKGTQGNAMELISRKLTSRGDFFYKVSFIHQ